jgi:hypothetical protein
MEEKILNTTEAENQLLSTIKRNWDNLGLKSILKTMTKNKKQKMLAEGGGKRGVDKINNLLSLSSNNSGSSSKNDDDDNGRLVYKIKLLYSAAASASTSTQQQSRGGSSNSVLNDTILLLDAKN